jgi:hypothetical protein
MNFRIFALAAIFLFAQNAFAKTVILSDIDDTLKISHVGSKWDAFRRAYRTELDFSGMRDLLMFLGTEIEGAEFHYVSNAPASLMTDSHSRFLAEWKYPAGRLRLRDNLFEGNHKLVTITNLLEVEKPETAILIGDNSELDGLVYNELAKKFPRIRFFQFIRIAYTSGPDHVYYPLFPNQVGFVSPVEIALTLNAAGEIPSTETSEFTKKQQFKVAQAEDVAWGPGYFPDWMDCRDFRWQQSSFSGELKNYNEKIKARCGRAPSILDLPKDLPPGVEGFDLG